MKILVRKQFSFKASDCQINKILECITKNNINVMSMDVKKYKHEKNHVHLIVGLTNSTENDRKWNKILKSILKEVKICKYSKNNVVQTADHGTDESGVFSREYGALFKCVEIYNIYLGEASSIIYDVSDLDKAIAILAKLN